MSGDLETLGGLSATKVQRMRGVFESFPCVEQAILYGSRASGRHRDNSDIDLSLVGSGITFSDMAQIDLALDDLLLPQKIDLSHFDELPAGPFRSSIEEHGVIFYSRNNESAAQRQFGGGAA